MGYKKLGFETYQDYLQSEHWTTLRQSIREERKTCEACGGNIGLSVHHHTYERVGQEELSDLHLICELCHTAIHTLCGKSKIKGLAKNTKIFIRSIQLRFNIKPFFKEKDSPSKKKHKKKKPPPRIKVIPSKGKLPKRLTKKQRAKRMKLLNKQREARRLQEEETASNIRRKSFLREVKDL